MKKYSFFLIVAVALFLSGCTKSAKLVVTDADANQIVSVCSNNDLGNFLSVVPSTYEVTSNNDTLSIELSFVVNANAKELKHGDFESLVFIPQNSEGAALGENIIFNACDVNDFVDAIFNADSADVVNVRFQYIVANDDEKKAIIDNLAKCKVELRLADFEETPEEDDAAYYDSVMDTYVEGAVNNNEEIIMATAENIGEAQMEGLLTPEQQKRWENIDKEVEEAKRAK